MSTLTHLRVHESQVRVDPRAGRDAVDRVTGQDLIAAVARLDPTTPIVSSATVVRGEDIVRVRRKAHGKADWIASVTSDVTVELTRRTPRGGQVHGGTGRDDSAATGRPRHAFLGWR